MATKGLLIAGVAMVLLVASVTVDLAFNSTLDVRAAPSGQSLVLVGQGALDGDPYARPAVATQTFRANASDTMLIEVELQNGYPWPATKSFTITRDGCYDGALVFDTVRVSAPPRGDGQATAQVNVGTLLRESTTYYPKAIEGPAAGSQPVYLQICSGSRYVATATFGIEEVAR